MASVAAGMGVAAALVGAGRGTFRVGIRVCIFGRRSRWQGIHRRTDDGMALHSQLPNGKAFAAVRTRQSTPGHRSRS